MQQSLDTIWKKIKTAIGTSENIRENSKHHLEWLSPSELSDGTLTIEGANDFVVAMAREHFSPTLSEILSNETPPLKFKIVKGNVSPNKPVQQNLPAFREEEKEEQPKSQIPPRYADMFNSKYSFESFVVGKSNQFAYTVCRSLTEKLGELHNPVFIYGGVGLGKTHLIQAIGREVLKQNPKAKVSYLSSEAFTNEFIDSIKDKKTVSFRTKYRKTDLLLIDDVQFFAGKEQTQEEFFHTFNELFQQKKQIVLTSDTLPELIPDIEERLASRFGMGVTVDIQPPDLETRAAILKNCAKKSMVEVNDDVILYLAEGVTSNIRALEGAFSSVLAFSGIMGRPISKDLVDQVLKDIIRENAAGKITVNAIQDRVSKFYDISKAEMTGKRRQKNLVLPRQIAMKLCQLYTDYSLAQIGSKFGGRDHTTVMHSCSKIEKMLKKDPDFQDEFNRVKRFVEQQ